MLNILPSFSYYRHQSTRRNLPMTKPDQTPTSKQQTYSKRRLAGLDAHTTAQKRATVDRLAAAIKSLKIKKLPISIKTIREECGLEYNSIKRNPEAFLLYQQN